MKYSGTLFNLIFSLALLITGTSVHATLFISEYVEGSNNNKAIELYNGGSADINLLAEDYSLRIFFNGSSSANGQHHPAGFDPVIDRLALSSSYELDNVHWTDR